MKQYILKCDYFEGYNNPVYLDSVVFGRNHEVVMVNVDEDIQYAQKIPENDVDELTKKIHDDYELDFYPVLIKD